MPFGIVGSVDFLSSGGKNPVYNENTMSHSKSSLSNYCGQILCSHWRRAALAVAIIVFLSPSALALDPSRALTQSIHRIWQMQQGLPQGTIYCVYQTQNRYLWLGTKTGLVRFDGVQFAVMRDVGGVLLENVWIRQLCE